MIMIGHDDMQIWQSDLTRFIMFHPVDPVQKTQLKLIPYIELQP
jgi:hypothetical protein